MKKLLLILLGMLIGIFIGIYIVEPQPFSELFNKFLEFVSNIKELVFNK